MKKSITFFVVFLLIVAVGSVSFAAEKNTQSKKDNKTKLTGNVKKIEIGETKTIKLDGGWNLEYVLYINDKTRLISDKGEKNIPLDSIKQGDSIVATCKGKTIDFITGYSTYQVGDEVIKSPMGLIQCADTEQIVVKVKPATKP